jgi:hypothetical protein
VATTREHGVAAIIEAQGDFLNKVQKAPCSARR